MPKIVVPRPKNPAVKRAAHKGSGFTKTTVRGLTKYGAPKGAGIKSSCGGK